MTSPTQRTLAHARKLGWIAAVTDEVQTMKSDKKDATRERGSETPPTVEVVLERGKGRGRGWVRLRGANGEVMLSSETYSRATNARRAAKVLAALIPGADYCEYEVAP